MLGRRLQQPITTAAVATAGNNVDTLLTTMANAPETVEHVWKVDNFVQRRQRRLVSDAFSCCGVRWRLSLHTEADDGGSDAISLTLSTVDTGAGSDVDERTHLPTTLVASLLNQTNAVMTITQERSMNFPLDGGRPLDIAHMVTMNRLLDPSAGFLVQGCIVFQCHVKCGSGSNVDGGDGRGVVTAGQRHNSRMPRTTRGAHYSTIPSSVDNMPHAQASSNTISLLVYIEGHCRLHNGPGPLQAQQGDAIVMPASNALIDMRTHLKTKYGIPTAHQEFWTIIERNGVGYLGKKFSTAQLSLPVSDLVRPLGARTMRLFLHAMESTAASQHANTDPSLQPLIFVKFYDAPTSSLEHVVCMHISSSLRLSEVASTVVCPHVGFQPSEILLAYKETVVSDNDGGDDSIGVSKLEYRQRLRDVMVRDGDVFVFEKMVSSEPSARMSNPNPIALPTVSAFYSNRRDSIVVHIKKHPRYDGPSTRSTLTLTLARSTLQHETIRQVASLLTIETSRVRLYGIRVNENSDGNNDSNEMVPARDPFEHGQSATVATMVSSQRRPPYTLFFALTQAGRPRSALSMQSGGGGGGGGGATSNTTTSSVTKVTFTTATGSVIVSHNITLSGHPRVRDVLSRLTQMIPLSGTGELRLMMQTSGESGGESGGSTISAVFDSHDYVPAVSNIPEGSMLRVEEVPEDDLDVSPSHKLLIVRRFTGRSTVRSTDWDTEADVGVDIDSPRSVIWLPGPMVISVSPHDTPSDLIQRIRHRFGNTIPASQKSRAAASLHWVGVTQVPRELDREAPVFSQGRRFGNDECLGLMCLDESSRAYASNVVIQAQRSITGRPVGSAGGTSSGNSMRLNLGELAGGSGGSARVGSAGALSERLSARRAASKGAVVDDEHIELGGGGGGGGGNIGHGRRGVPLTARARMQGNNGRRRSGEGMSISPEYDDNAAAAVVGGGVVPRVARLHLPTGRRNSTGSATDDDDNVGNDNHDEISLLRVELKTARDQLREKSALLVSLQGQVASQKARISSMEGEAVSLRQLSEEGLESMTSAELEQVESRLETLLSKARTLKIQQLKKEKEALEDRRLCKVCQDRETTIVLVPCGHHCLCERCSNQISQCPICRSAIAQKVKTYAG